MRVEKGLSFSRICREGNGTVAAWICIECSNEEQRPVLVCEDCLSEYHAEHYAEEILY